MPTVILGLVLGATFVADLLKRNFHRAMLTFFFGVFVIMVVSFACKRASETAGWIALAAVVGFLILVQLAKAGTFDTNKVPEDKCNPVIPSVINGSSGTDCTPPPAPPPVDPCDMPC